MVSKLGDQKVKSNTYYAITRARDDVSDINERVARATEDAGVAISFLRFSGLQVSDRSVASLEWPRCTGVADWRGTQQRWMNDLLAGLIKPSSTACCLKLLKVRTFNLLQPSGSGARYAGFHGT